MNKGTLSYVKGDVTSPQTRKDEIPVIVHVCNDKGVMGAGVALALKKKWSGVYESYRQGDLVLGHNSVHVELEEEDAKVIIINMIAQHGLKGPSNPKPLKYQALIECMQRAYNTADSCQLSSPGKRVVIHCPKFGSALAGGTWEFIEELVQEMWVDKGYHVVVYEFEADQREWGPINFLD